MKMIQKWVLSSLVLSALLSLGACGTVVGAGAGAVGGSVLTGGSAVGTIGGAAVGAVIGNEVTKPE